ncbi:MAG: hypothetical protein ACYTEQ_01475 [Planctomycetota bacterium]|jgi:hypothetical protein
MATYNETDPCPFDLDKSTPTEGATPPSEVNNAIREIKLAFKNVHAVKTAVNATTLTETDSVLMCGGATSFTVTMPAVGDVSNATVSKPFEIFNIGSATITIDGNGAETIDGAATVTLRNQYTGLRLWSDGSGWYTKEKYQDRPDIYAPTITAPVITGGDITGASIYGGSVNASEFDINTSQKITKIKDDDTMASDSATMLCTQQSIKAYADNSKGFAVFAHTAASGVNPGTLTTGTWTKRKLNDTLENSITGATLGSYQVTLPAGRYEIAAEAMHHKVDGFVPRLRNKTDDTTMFRGLSGYADDNLLVAVPGHVGGEVTLSTETTFEMQSGVSKTKNSVGQGFPAGAGTETYARVEIRKLS